VGGATARVVGSLCRTASGPLMSDSIEAGALPGFWFMGYSLLPKRLCRLIAGVVSVLVEPFCVPFRLIKLVNDNLFGKLITGLPQ